MRVSGLGSRAGRDDLATWDQSEGDTEPAGEGALVCTVLVGEQRYMRYQTDRQGSICMESYGRSQAEGVDQSRQHHCGRQSEGEVGDSMRDFPLAAWVGAARAFQGSSTVQGEEGNIPSPCHH